MAPKTQHVVQPPAASSIDLETVESALTVDSQEATPMVRVGLAMAAIVEDGAPVSTIRAIIYEAMPPSRTEATAFLKQLKNMQHLGEVIWQAAQEKYAVLPE